jgi:hypothetical protein
MVGVMESITTRNAGFEFLDQLMAGISVLVVISRPAAPGFAFRECSLPAQSRFPRGV